MICWRRRSSGKYKRIVRGKVVEQTYTSAPERQLLCAPPARAKSARTRNSARASQRHYDKVDAAAMPSLGGDLVKKMCVAAATEDRENVAWRA